ncbi:MAG: hypothetical protein COW59_04145 [Lysobacterales bacterium CG17_big_fil_post_rev_8_21_14_2_50_64_11]|nr:MAG: hypothetical protein COW59_04145 [Xanthomonadales bacterium CG17_big_fil_post_rev_8_21_14_2_50_64_11]
MKQLRAGTVLCSLLPLLLPASSQAAKFTLPAERPIVVRADVVANDPEQNVTRLRGNFSIEGSDWPMQADQATVYGPLENPTRVLVTGNPARIWVKNNGIERDVAAQANEIEYARNLEVLRLRGNAQLVQGGRRSLAGEYFEYDLKADKVSQGGPVRISILPAKAAANATQDAAAVPPEQQPR